jgi:Luciferase-like monooxygenase
LLVPDHDVLFGASLGQWNGVDAADPAGRIRLATQADRDGLDPAAAPAPRVFTGSVGPKSLAVTGQLADGWIPPGGSDWLSQLFRESRPRVDAAAVAAGRDPAGIVTVFNFGGRITLEPLAAPRGEDGRWIGGSVQQWVTELTTAVLEHNAAGFIYRTTDDTPAGEALARWATEIVPAVREAIA